MKAEDQMMKVIDWCCYTKDRGKLPFVLPEIRPEEVAVGYEMLYVCLHAIKRLINFGWYKWQRAKDHVLKGHQYVDLRKGNNNATLASEVKEALHDFFMK